MCFVRKTRYQALFLNSINSEKSHGDVMVSGNLSGGTRKILFLNLIGHLIAFSLFINGYLLTRTHLPERSTAFTTAVCDRPYKKVVWIVIDALRYDFVLSDGRYPCNGCIHQGHMPILTALAHNSNNNKSRETTAAVATKALRYIADAPTTTTQRLKSMVSGGLPTFFDVSNAFTAGPMDEDNLIDQMMMMSTGSTTEGSDDGTAATWRSVFMGDATWTNLFPTQFNTSLPFPCFNVKDLDSVDDGIWENLIPVLRRPADWDLLIAHYLGVDHAGHAHGVDSHRMVKKLRQMDEYIGAVVEEMKAGAGQGGPFEDALLLIAGDHGQTMGGDHGGGSPEEVDSVLVAVDIAALRRQEEPGEDEEIIVRSNNDDGDCKFDCSCGEDKNQCVEDLPQIDLVPTLAAMLNIPVPFGNLGRLSSELWTLAGQRCGGAAALNKAAAANAVQVHTYLNTYALRSKGARFPVAALKRLNEEYEEVVERYDGGGDDSSAVTADFLSYITDATAVAKQAWTQFNDVSIVAGVLAFVAALSLHGAWAWRALCSSSNTPSNSNSRIFSNWKDVVLCICCWAGVAAHCSGIFSFFYLLSEGTSLALILAGIVASVVLMNMLASGNLTRKWKLVLLGVLSLSCIYATSVLGLVSHSGYGFWQRLTVHDIQEVSNVEEGSGSSSFFASFWHFFDGLGIYGDVLKHTAVFLGPTIVLYQLVQTKSMKSGGGFPAALQRFLIGCSFLFLAVHNVLVRLPVAHQVDQHTLAEASSFFLAKTGILLVPLSHHHHLPSFMHLPLHLLVPRLVLCLSVLSVVLVLLRHRHMSSSMEVSTSLSGSVLPVLLLISRTVTPLLALLCVVEAMAITALLVTAATTKGSALASIAALFSILQTHAFFVTGHLCEFAGLQYTAGFVGYEEFHLWRSGGLVMMDAFGGMAAAAMALVLAAAVIDSNTKYSFIKSHRSKQNKMNKTSKLLPSSSLSCLLLMFGLARAAAAFCATVSAAIQRRHLYAWALFAPKFAIEVFFLVATDVVLLFIGVVC